MLDCKPAKSPVHSKVIMSLRKEGEEQTDRARYLTAVGSLARSGMPCLKLDQTSLIQLVYSDNLQAIHQRHTGKEFYLCSNTSSIRAISESPTLEDLTSSMASVPTLQQVILIDDESQVAISLDCGVGQSAGSLRNNPPSRSQQGMQNMLPSLKLLES